MKNRNRIEKSRGRYRYGRTGRLYWMRTAALVVICACLIAVPAPDTCSASQPKLQSESQTESKSGAQPVKVALILATSGIAATDNSPALKAADLAIDELNRSGGLLGRPLQLMVIDNQSTPLGSKVAAKKAAAADVIAVVGALWSSHSMAMAPVLQDAGIPMISPASTQPEITIGRDYIFRVSITDVFQGRVMARFAYHDLQKRTAMVMTNINEAYCITLARYFISAFTGFGGQLVWQDNYAGKAVDFSNSLNAARKISADVFFIPGYARDSGLIIKQATALGIKTVFMGGDGWGEGLLAYGGEATEGAYFSTQWHPDAPSVPFDELKQKFRHKFGPAKIVDMRVPLTYDALQVLFQAVKSTQSFERPQIRAALALTSAFEGSTGTITFNPDGDPVDKPVSILKYENGHTVFVKSITP